MTIEQPEQYEPKQIDHKLFDFSVFQIEKLHVTIQLADSKAQFILAGNTVLVSVTVILFPDMRDILVTKDIFPLLIYIGLLGVFAVATLISMLQAFLVVYPRYSPFSKEKSHPSLLYFREISHGFNGADEYNQALVSSSLQDILTNAGSEIYGISVNADRKYRLLRLSIGWLIAGVITWIFLLAGTLLLSL